MGAPESEPASPQSLALPTDVEFIQNATLKYVSEALGLKSKQEAKELVESDAIQDAFCAFSDAYLRPHPRAPPPQPGSIRPLFSLSRYFDDPEVYFENLRGDFPDHADACGAEFTFRVVQFLVSDECLERWNDIVDVIDWDIEDVCDLCTAILLLLQRVWQANHK